MSSSAFFVLERDAFLERGKEVIRAEADALTRMATLLDTSFTEVCTAILATRGRVVVTGMGKSGLIGRKWAATLSATGTPAIFVHPAEASHGDLGMLVPGDLLIAISNSGNTVELRDILRYAALIGVTVVGVASRADCLVMRAASIRLVYPAVREACAANVAPTTSTTLQMALGDALALALMDRRGFSVDQMKKLHPGGMLGLRMTPVRDLMRRDPLPLVARDTPMRDVLVLITSAGCGLAGVVDGDGRLIGVITDGDLRRHFETLDRATAGDVMNPRPRMLSAHTLAEQALKFCSDNKINAAFVVEGGVFAVDDGPSEPHVPTGLVHLHDFLRLGLC